MPTNVFQLDFNGQLTINSIVFIVVASAKNPFLQTIFAMFSSSVQKCSCILLLE